MSAMRDLSVRSASAPDIDAIAEIERHCFPGPEGLSRAQITTLMARPDVRFLVAEHEGEITGFAALQMGEKEAKILTIDVLSHQRRKGVGRRLLRELEATALRSGMLGMRLEVREGNTAAIALYERSGYQRQGRIPNYYFYPDGNTRDAVVMRKGLGRHS
ncbi:MAG: ribosomal protein S18-alanine N-acetyltransferase [Candidatus Thermoplasmatota archaeon]